MHICFIWNFKICFAFERASLYIAKKNGILVSVSQCHYKAAPHTYNLYIPSNASAYILYSTCMVNGKSKFVTFAFHKCYFLFRRLNNKICKYFTVIFSEMPHQLIVLSFLFFFIHSHSRVTLYRLAWHVERDNQRRKSQFKIFHNISFDRIIVSTNEWSECRQEIIWNNVLMVCFESRLLFVTLRK